MASPASAYSSPASSPIHPASLVDPALHSPHTLRLVNLKISKQLIDHVVDQVIETVDYAMGKSGAPSSRGRTSSTRTPHQIKFTTFASTVLSRAEITTPTLLCTLLYIHRARPYLHIALEEWALERVFLGALITASKYLNDSTLKNVHWALCTGVFGKRDVGRIEREFLAVLDWELGVSEGELLGLWESLEWAVEMEEREERRVREREARRKAMAAAAEKEQREQARQQSKLFYFSSSTSSTSSSSSSSSSLDAHSRSSSTDSDFGLPPPLPPKSTTTPHRRHRLNPTSIDLPALSHSSASPSSSSASSSSSCSNASSPRTPLTPGDFELSYPEPEELERAMKEEEDMRMQVDEPSHGVVVVPTIVVEEAAAASQGKIQQQQQQRRCVKRSFGATTMEILKSFPFPGHHSHSQHATA